MDFEPDVVYVVVEFLAKAKAPVPQQEVLEEIPFDRRAVTGVLFALFACGFLVREASAGSSRSAGPGAEAEYSFSVTKSISAYQIIKLGELGVDMNSLAGLVRISERQKQAAMALTTQSEKLAEMDGEVRAKRAETASKNAVALPAPRDSIVDTLERLAMASEMSIKEMKGAKGSEDVLRALFDAKEQAMRALTQYQEQLRQGDGSPTHSGF